MYDVGSGRDALPTQWRFPQRTMKGFIMSATRTTSKRVSSAAATPRKGSAAARKAAAAAEAVTAEATAIITEAAEEVTARQ